MSSKSALIVGNQPLFRLAIAELLIAQRLTDIRQAESVNELSNVDIGGFDLLVICAEADLSLLFEPLIAAPGACKTAVVLFSPVFGKHHRQLLSQRLISLCLPLSVSCSVAEEYLARVIAPEWGLSGVTAIRDRRLQPLFMPDLTDLSNNERGVLYHLQQGLSNQAIAERMNVQPNTVKVHLSRACRKAGFNNRTQAARTTRDFLGCGRDLHYRVA